MYPENTLCWVCERAEDSQEHIRCNVLHDILSLENAIQYEHINRHGDQQTFERYLELQDKLQDNPSENFSLPGLYSGPVRPQAGTTALAGRSN